MKYIGILTILLLMCNVCIGGDVNIPPEARITYEQQSKTVIYFDSSDSFDEDGFICKETWRIIGFDDDVLDEIDAEMYQFVAPDAFGERMYSIKLTVEDNSRTTNYDIVHVYTMHGEISSISHVFGYEEKVPITIETNDGLTPLATVPGFESVFALIGLLSVVWLIKRDEE